MAKTNSNDAVIAAALNAGMPEGFEVIEMKLALEKEGDTVLGVYVGTLEDIVMSGKAVHRYKVETEPGKLSTVLGSAKIDQFFSGVKEGDHVWIRRGVQGKSAKGRLNDYMFARKPA